MEEGTQGLHFCRLEPRMDDPPADDRATAELEELHQRTRAMANQIMAPVRVSGPSVVYIMNAVDGWVGEVICQIFFMLCLRLAVTRE